jgi:hypothetical protein
MKATTWRKRAAFTAAALAFASGAFLVAPCARATGLPDGLPELPGVGETMQRNIRSGLALGGFDPVAYHAQGRAAAGRADYEIVHRGDVWRFASAANRAAFVDAPAIYEPAFQGYDPTGVAEGLAVETDPRLFAVVGQRLFLFRNAANRTAFLADDALRRKAEANWSTVNEAIAHH